MDKDQEKESTANTAEYSQTDSVDWFLQSLVTFANKFQLFFGVTLSVGGVLISGDVIDGKTYFEAFAADMKQGFLPIGEEFASQMEDAFRSYGDVYKNYQDLIREQMEGKRSEIADEDTPRVMKEPGYIHLRDAKVYHPSGTPIPGNKGVLWRVRLGAVDGFTLGRLGVGQST